MKINPFFLYLNLPARMRKWLQRGILAWFGLQVGMFVWNQSPSSQQNAWSRAELVAAADAGQQAAVEMKSRFPNADSASLFPCLKDGQKACTRAWMAELGQRGIKTHTGSPIESFSSQMSRIAINADRPGDLLTAGSRVEMDLILGGRITDRSVTTNQEAEVTLEWVAVAPHATDKFQRGTITGSWSPKSEAEKAQAARPNRWPLHWHLGWRILLFVGSLILLLLAALPWLGQVLEARSNVVSAFYLAGLTAAGLGLFILYFAPTCGSIGWIAAGAVLALVLWMGSEHLASIREG